MSLSLVIVTALCGENVAGNWKYTVFVHTWIYVSMCFKAEYYV